MNEIFELTEIISKLAGIDKLMIMRKENVENCRTVHLRGTSNYLNISDTADYSTVFFIKRLFELYYERAGKITARELFVADYLHLAADLLKRAACEEDGADVDREYFGFLEGCGDYAILREGKPIINHSIDKNTLNTSLLKLRSIKEFGMHVRNGEVYAVKETYYQAILSSKSILREGLKTSLKVHLAFLNKLYENELYMLKLRDINQRLEAAVASRTIEIEQKNKLLEEEKAKLNDANAQLVALNRHLAFLTKIDPLTELLNRRGMEEGYTLARARSGGAAGNSTQDDLSADKLSEDNFAVILGDIDHFKQINDTYGHECGDLVLKSLARRMKDNYTDSSMICRYGGEEFLIFEPSARKDDSFARVERLRKVIEETTVNSGGIAVRLTMSFGIYLTGGDDGLQECVKNADRALYLAKKGGRNKTVLIEKGDSVAFNGAHPTQFI